jgi:hypothetical protein
MKGIKTGWPLVLLVALLLVALPTGAQAQWVYQGTGLCTETGNAHYPVMAPDGEGGFFVTWQDARSGSNLDIYVQHVNASGEVLWTDNGVPLCAEAGSQGTPIIVSDGAGGAIVAWYDQRGSDQDIYAQRVDPDGMPLWAEGGVGLCTAIYEQNLSSIISDGSGGAIVTWSDYRSNTDFDVYAQRIDASGAVQWTTNGVAVCTVTGDQFVTGAASDDAGGTVITWIDGRGTDNDIYVQRVDTWGAKQWTTDGVPLCTAIGTQWYPEIVSDGLGGAIVVWEDYRNGTDSNIYAQRVGSNGSIWWTTGGVGVYTGIGEQSDLDIISDELGGAIVAWRDYRSGTSYDVYAQHIGPWGGNQWSAGGVAICTDTHDQHWPTIASDGAGGAIVGWYDARSIGTDIYVQSVDVSGSVRWTSDGIPLCTAGGFQFITSILSDGDGGAIVAWHDERKSISDVDVYAQRVTRQGYWGHPAPQITSIEDVPGDEGGQLRIRFNRSRLDTYPDLAITHYSIWRALSPFAALAMKVDGIRLSSPSLATEDMAGVAYYSSPAGDWEFVGTMEPHLLEEYGYTAETLRDSTSVDPGLEYFFVSAHGTGDLNFWDSGPAVGYSVDNLSPCAPAALAAEIAGCCELYLHWNPNTEIDLHHYVVYKGAAPGFVPDETNRVGAATDTFFVDPCYGDEEQYYYKVSAIDVHENESLFALLTPDMIAGVPGEGPRYGNFLFQNAPNPFVSATRIAFSLKKEGQVRLKVFDATGRLVRTLVDEVRGPNRYVEQWDGRDGSGRSLSSGTYFYTLEIPGWSDSKKMTLAR